MLIKPKSSWLKIVLVLGVLFTTSCALKNSANPTLNKLVAQKLMIDLRYFCVATKSKKHCTQPVTELIEPLASLIADTGIGGVILFADNIENTSQILHLNYALQEAAKAAGHPPLFIAIDQEGGRVVRLPKHLGTPLAGNMAIGATYAKYGDRFATQTGEVLAKELMSLGFNLNFAPIVDVNVNPLNPVINVRSFGENAEIVASLGTAQMTAMQNQGMMATLKHFPGHGDTNVDSHTGLPRVDHSLLQVEATDLLPFQHAIDNSSPAMIMTAHIQYPELDNTEFKAKDGSSIILPATMSRKILTGLLRNKMGYDGVIITDALNMAGVSHYFDETEAVIQTFSAGADIALMPTIIRYPSDIKKLKKLINNVANEVQRGQLSLAEIEASVQRIVSLKEGYQLKLNTHLPIEQAINKATLTLGSKHHKKIEQQLANKAVVAVKNNGVLPLESNINKVLLVMPDTTKCMGLTLALKSRKPSLHIKCNSIASHDADIKLTSLEWADMLITADITPDQSLAELGGMDDLKHKSKRSSKQQQNTQQLRLLKTARDLAKKTVFVSFRTPYKSYLFSPFSDAILASFDYRLNQTQYWDDFGRFITEYQGPSFNALADVIIGNIQAQGSLPVSVQRIK
ncbi:MAG: glycoside hydrolase family 3 protein [Paraglaciecola sp.]|uniref:glycoside hydrolase family 3 protein n=1 Tax=Paraglaciecola sp. TaxID=1920173 RepID=UPI003296F6D6